MKLLDLYLEAPSEWLLRPIEVLLVGCGGTGSEVVDALAMQHLALIANGGKGINVTAFDEGLVRASNISRQRFWPCDIGQYKSICLINRYNLLLGTNWRGIPDNLDIVSDEKGALYSEAACRADILISAVDLPSVRSAISKLSVNDDLIWLDFGNGKDFGQAYIGVLTNSKSKRKVAKEFPTVVEHHPEIHSLPDNNQKSCSAAQSLMTQDVLINRAVATAGMGILWQLIKQGKTKINGVIVDLTKGKQTPIYFTKANQ